MPIYILAFLILFLVTEIFDIVLLLRSMRIIKEAKEDGVITDEEKELIKLSALQAIGATIAVGVGIAAIVMYIISLV